LLLPSIACGVNKRPHDPSGPERDSDRNTASPKLVERLLEACSTAAPALINLTKFGYSRATVLRLKRLERRASPAVQAAVRAGEVPVRDVDALVTLSKGEQEEVAEREGAAGLRQRAADVRAERREAREPRPMPSPYTGREAEWRRERVRPIAEPPPIPSPRVLEARGEALAGDLISEVGGLEASWARHSEREQLIFLRHKLGSIERALTPEHLQQLAALYPPEPPVNGLTGNIDLMKQSDKVKRKTRDMGTLDLCSLVERAISERSVAALAGR
jgi:hypothetical protein